MTIKSLIKPGQKVILSPYTISDVINMVVAAGGIPVFADVERATCNIDPESVSKMIDDNTGAVLVTHFYGLIANWEPIKSLCDSFNIPMIEDAAQAFDAEWKGKKAGSYGHAGIYSFGLYKSINTLYGGMVVTNDSELAARLRHEIARWPSVSVIALIKKMLGGLSTHFATSDIIFQTLSYWIFRYGYLKEISFINRQVTIDLHPVLRRNIPSGYLWRYAPGQARLALNQLGGLAKQLRKRIATARLYYEGLKGLPGLTLPPMRVDGSHLYPYYVIQCSDRHELVRYAMERRRDLAVSHHKNCASMECFSEYATPCPNAQYISNSAIYLPTYPEYTDSEVEATINVIREYIREHKE
jgi:dTDP-4-amino-4,6-dideoxygalactose transaminase